MRDVNIYKKKPNGRYEQVGYEWTGWPANGLWIVEDGTQTNIMLLSSTGKLPHMSLQVHQYVTDVEQKVFDRLAYDHPKGYTVGDVVRITAQEYAKILS